MKRFYLYSLATPLGISIVINTREEGVTTFPINEGESKMLVMIGWEAAALEVDFDLRDPKGTLITPQNLPSGLHVSNGSGRLVRQLYGRKSCGGRVAAFKCATQR